MNKFVLPSGKEIDVGFATMAMEDTDLANHYFLNTETGEVVFFSDHSDFLEEIDKKFEQMQDEKYVEIDRLFTYQKYNWMTDFVDLMIFPKDEKLAKMLVMALNGKGAFRRFNDVMHNQGEKWLDDWYKYKEKRMHKEFKGWIESLKVNIAEKKD